MKRRKEREFALQLLYAVEVTGDQPNEQLDRIAEDLGKYSTPFARSLIETVYDNHEQIDTYIRQQLINWDYKRVTIIDKILLRLAMAEFLYFETIPPEVTINEVLEISKIYSTKKSSKFINGVLDGILKKLTTEHKLNKKGRGVLPPAKK